MKQKSITLNRRDRQLLAESLMARKDIACDECCDPTTKLAHIGRIGEYNYEIDQIDLLAKKIGIGRTHFKPGRVLGSI